MKPSRSGLIFAALSLAALRVEAHAVPRLSAGLSAELAFDPLTVCGQPGAALAIGIGDARQSVIARVSLAHTVGCRDNTLRFNDSLGYRRYLTLAGDRDRTVFATVYLGASYFIRDALPGEIGLSLAGDVGLTLGASWLLALRVEANTQGAVPIGLQLTWGLP
ncbi:MAG: hypothetical protein JNK72_08120 [Myxococcales bacterium]|nr:hypothetical protein [Myxococcales bacterium]